MGRAHIGVLLTDSHGEIVPSTTLTIQKADGTSLGQTIYNAASGGSSIPTPTTDAGGRFDGYVDVPVRSRITPSGGTARIEDFAPDPSDVVIQNATVPVVLGGYDGPLAVLALRPLDDVNAYALRVRDDDGSDIFRVRKSPGGRNLVLLGDDGTLPETALLHAYQSLTANNQQIINIDAFVGTPSVVNVKGLNVSTTQSIAGAANITAAKFLAVRGSATSASETVAVKAWLQSDKASGSPKFNVGAWVSSIGTQANDTAVLIDGSGGWIDFIRGYTSADAMVFQVTATGAIVGASLVTTGSISGVNVTASGAVTASGNVTGVNLIASTGVTAVNVTATGGFASTTAVGAGSPTLLFTGGASGIAGMYSGSANVLGIGTASTERMKFDAAGNIVLGTAAIATNATDGFEYMVSCAGTPTGAATAYTGRVPWVVDTTGSKIWFRIGGTWKGVVVA